MKVQGPQARYGDEVVPKDVAVGYDEDDGPGPERENPGNRWTVCGNQGASGGLFILECENLDEAIEWAAKIPTRCRGGEGCIEIRPLRGLTKHG